MVPKAGREALNDSRHIPRSRPQPSNCSRSGTTQAIKECFGDGRRPPYRTKLAGWLGTSLINCKTTYAYSVVSANHNRSWLSLLDYFGKKLRIRLTNCITGPQLA